MKKYLIVLLSIFMFAVQGSAGDTVLLTEHIDENGKRTAFVTTKDVIEKSPSWKLDKEPPLPIHKAIQIADKWIKTKYPKFTAFNIISVSISKIWEHKQKDKWYYTISTAASADVDGISAHTYFSVIVLMDGTVVGPSSPKNSE